MLLLVVMLAQAVPLPSHPKDKTNVPPPNVRCVADSFGNYTCTDGSRVIRDSFGNVTVIPGRK
jgi:hypothetical protein